MTVKDEPSDKRVFYQYQPVNLPRQTHADWDGSHKLRRLWDLTAGQERYSADYDASGTRVCGTTGCTRRSSSSIAHFRP